MKLRPLAFFAFALIGLGPTPAAATAEILTVRVETPAQLVARCSEAWEHLQTVIQGGSCPSAREIMCAGPEGALIADDDPGLALFPDIDMESAKIAMAIEQTNSCDDEDRLRFKVAQDELYRILTGGEFLCDDHPERCRGADEPDTFGWSVILPATKRHRPRRRDCGNPYTTLVWRRREFECLRDERGIWTMEEVR